MRKQTLIAVLTIFTIASTSYAIDPNDIDWFELSDWSSITDGESNFFPNVCGDDNLTVTAVGAFPTGNKYAFGPDGYIESGLLLPDQSHSFVFDYTGSEQLVVEILTLDSEEFAEVRMPGDEQWQTVSGNDPDVSPALPNGLRFQGVATGFPGVSNFLVYSSDPVSTVTVTFGSLNFDKHEFVRIGKVVPIPEPGTFSLLGLALLGMVCGIRRK